MRPGKSTASSAWLDSAFWSAAIRHPYRFLHARKGNLLVGGRHRSTRRRGPPDASSDAAKRQGSLHDKNGRAFDERQLSLLLHGLDRDGYSHAFSRFDDEVDLAPLAARRCPRQGDLGQLLVMARSSGLSVSADLLKQAEEEVDAFQ